MGLGLGTNTFGIFPRKTVAETVMQQAVALNDIPAGMTFTRATSAWDPLLNVIQPPGVRRRNTEQVGRFRVFAGDLIEGAGTNLLKAGTSDNFNLWSSISAQLVGGQTAPDGSATAWTITDSSAAAFQSIQQTITVANDASTYCISIYILKTSGGTSATCGFNASLLGGTTVAVSPRLDTDTGSVFISSGTPIAVSVGIWWRLQFVLTNNTSGNTSLSLTFFPATAANGQSIDSSAAVGTATIAWAQVEKSTFPTSFISNRNMILHTQQFSNAAWNVSSPTGSVVDNAQLDPNGAMDAASVTFTGSGVDVRYNSSSGFAQINGMTMTFSIWLKAAAATTIGLRITNATTGTDDTIITCPITTSWQRFTVTRAFTSTGTSVQCGMDNRVADGGPGTAQTIYAWGAQLEYGSSATPYWGVDATVGGRDQDNLKVSVAGLPGGGLSTTAGTLIALMIPSGWTIAPNGTTAILCDDSVTTAHTTLDTGSAGLAACQRTDSVNNKVANVAVGTPSNGVIEHVAMVWGASNLTCYRNGVAGTPTATVPPYVLTTGLQIGAAQTLALPANAHIVFLYIPRALSAAEVMAVYNARSTA